MEIQQQEIQKERDFIRSKVIEHNLASLPERLKHPKEETSFIIRNENGDIIGGITGTAYWQHMHIDFLWVDSAFRSQRLGSQLVEKLEAYAREKQYRLLIVDTFSFQAPEFYKKQGFHEFGVLEDHPEGYSQHFFEKRLM